MLGLGIWRCIMNKGNNINSLHLSTWQCIDVNRRNLTFSWSPSWRSSTAFLCYSLILHFFSRNGDWLQNSRILCVDLSNKCARSFAFGASCLATNDFEKKRLFCSLERGEFPFLMKKIQFRVVFIYFRSKLPRWRKSVDTDTIRFLWIGTMTAIVNYSVFHIGTACKVKAIQFKFQ